MTSQTLFYVVAISVIWLLFRPLRNFKLRQALMLLISYLLYASWGLRFLGLLVGSSLLNYVWGVYLRRQPSAARLWGGIFLNIAFLSTFKYLPAISLLLPHTSWSGVFAGIVLPVGISFWTFQALSYLLDVYRGDELQPSLLEFLLYMAFWPTVLSGPICRLPNLLPQFRESPKASGEDVRSGLDRICLGLVMTTLGQALASGVQLGQGLDGAFDRISRGWTGLDVWCMAIGYGFELFLNFAGYSHLVIGAARLFSIRLDENFDRPYLATTPSQFWTRWHMSLSFWIRDYLFLPLVMVRREKWWRNVTLVVSMIVFGLWHKGSVLFVGWGFYQGVLLVLHRQGQQLQRRLASPPPAWIVGPLSWLLTFGAICLGWILFRANDVAQALAMLRAAGTPSAYLSHMLPASLYFLVFACVFGYFGVVGADQLRRKYLGAVELPIEIRCALYSIAFYVGILHMAQTQAFIYFQF
jgi:alginate O-acetyltransferase complex protein AlgI